jgi:hypothetical protein
MYGPIFYEQNLGCIRSIWSSSESDKDGSDSEEDDLRVMQMITKNKNNVVLAVSFMPWYYATYIDKNEPRTVTFSGLAWVKEALNSRGECYEMFRMDPSLFYKLHDELVSDFGLTSSINMTSMECLRLFLVICGHDWSNSGIKKDFKSSKETISRKFTDVLHCMVAMLKRYIQPNDPNFHKVHSRIANDQRMFPHFEDCIEAIDGSHINANPPKKTSLDILEGVVNLPKM